jgi:hypothetical protein
VISLNNDTLLFVLLSAQVADTGTNKIGIKIRQIR